MAGRQSTVAVCALRITEANSHNMKHGGSKF
jgi:hypothetical protein